MKIVNKIILIISVLILMLSQNAIYASMADYTDEQADQNLRQEQEELQKEQEERINKSSNNYLKSLSVDGYEITPEFDKQTINYEITQEVTKDYIEINAETDDEKSSVSGNGKVALNSGENNLKIDVVAENGTVRTYFIKVVKSAKKNVRLDSLKLEIDDNDNIEITPEFDKDTFEYNCNVQNYINKINVEAIASDENANIEITGNENLQDGFNEILIAVSVDNDEKTVYKINIYKEPAVEMQEEKQEIDYKNIMIIIIVIAIMVLIAFYIRKRKK